MQSRSLLILVAIAAAACGASEAATSAEPATIAITATDYGYQGLPEEIVAGSTLTMTNESDVELHELVAVPIPASDTRTGAEIMADPDGLAALFPTVEHVIIAEPLGDGFPVEGTGTLSEPGRYLIICAIPTGANPSEYLAAAAEAEGGPPQVDGGPPHFVNGMWQEVTVTDS